MTLSVWKFPLVVDDSQSISVPVGAQLLAVQLQRGGAQLWALCDTQKPTEQITILMRGTGHSIDVSVGQYLGTVQILGGDLIFHFFAAPR